MPEMMRCERSSNLLSEYPRQSYRTGRRVSFPRAAAGLIKQTAIRHGVRNGGCGECELGGVTLSYTSSAWQTDRIIHQKLGKAKKERWKDEMTMICLYCLDVFKGADMCPYCGSVGVEPVEGQE